MDIETVHDILAGFSIALFAVGIPANILSHFVCLRKTLKSTPTFIIISFTAIFDAISLCFWNIDHVTHQYFNDFMIEDIHVALCRIYTFLQCISLQTSAWLLVRDCFFLTVISSIFIKYKIYDCHGCD